jgi:hypothetical protein
MIGYRPNLSTNSFPISARHELLPAPRVLTDAGNLNSTSFRISIAENLCCGEAVIVDLISNHLSLAKSWIITQSIFGLLIPFGIAFAFHQNKVDSAHRMNPDRETEQ